jgi:hypothetical protein
MLSYLKTLTFILFHALARVHLAIRILAGLPSSHIGVLVVLALFIAFTFAVGFYLKDSQNAAAERPSARSMRNCFNTLRSRKGVFYTTLVFYVVGTTVVNGEVPLTDFDRQFMFDWMYGSGYATLLVYVSLLAMLLFFQKLSSLRATCLPRSSQR